MHKSVEVQCHFVPKRSTEKMAGYMQERLQDVQATSVTTDCSRSYQAILASLPNVSHFTVPNDSGPQHWCAHQLCESLKRDCRVQFQRMPIVQEGDSRYLDLVVWRTNSRLEATRSAPRPEHLAVLMLALHAWHSDELVVFNPHLVMVHDGVQPNELSEEAR